MKSNKYGTEDFRIEKVLKETMLNFASLGANSNKFYELKLLEGKLNGSTGYMVKARYGRLGVHGVEQEKVTHSLYEAENEFEKTIRSKNSKGYKEVLLGNDHGTANIKNKVDDSITDEVLLLISRLYTNTTSYITKSVQTALGNLSGKQVAKGYEVLEEINDAIKNNADEIRLERLSNEFYSHIPVIFGRQVNKVEMLIDSFDKITKNRDLLGVMSSYVGVKQGTIQNKYDSLGIDLQVKSPRTKDFKMIDKLIMDSRGYNHNKNIKVEKVFEVKNMKGHDKFNPYKVDTQLLFHGTRSENVLNILQTALTTAPKNVVITGKMFGNGIYTASCSSKSLNYCGNGYSSNVSGRNKDTKILFVCEVATGKMKELTSSDSSLTKAPYGYNSVKGCKGNHLLHDEYIVYNNNQVKIKYLVEVSCA